MASSIISLGIKTVSFIAYYEDASFKDIVLLNLTTEIALSICLMDMLERAYSEHKSEARYGSENSETFRQNQENRKEMS